MLRPCSFANDQMMERGTPRRSIASAVVPIVSSMPRKICRLTRHSQPASARAAVSSERAAERLTASERREPEPLLRVLADRALEETDRLAQCPFGVAGDFAIDPARLAEQDLVVSPPAAQRHDGHHGRARKPGELEWAFLKRRLRAEELDALDRGIGIAVAPVDLR